jgi:hypothetical protein
LDGAESSTILPDAWRWRRRFLDLAAHRLRASTRPEKKMAK